MASLIKQDMPEDLEELKIFLDGTVKDELKKHIKGIVSDICEIKYSNIELFCKAKLDKKCLLTNKADRISYFINKKFDMDYACFHPNYRGLIR